MSALLASLPLAIPKLFQDSQSASTTHRRNVLALRKLHLACVSVPERDNHAGGEALFNEGMFNCVARILPLKRREPCAEKTIKFIASFLQYSQEKDTARQENNKEKRRENETTATEHEATAMEIDDDDNNGGGDGHVSSNDNESDATPDEEDTVTERLVSYLINRLLPGLNAKDKNVRYRCSQLLALIVNYVGELDETLFEAFLRGMMDRVRDREPSIRVQAVLALAKLQNGDGDQLDLLIRSSILERMRRDPSSDVRRAAVLNLSCDDDSSVDILRRSRDIDAITRRYTFAKPMAELSDFRMLSIEQREQLIKSGLSDRDPAVKQACISMLLYHWLPHAENNLLEFLKRLDVMNTVVARHVLEDLFLTHPEIIQGIEFDGKLCIVMRADSFWEDLTPEGVLFFRVYLEYCHKKEPERFDSLLPNVTGHVLNIQRYSRMLTEAEARGEEDDLDAYDFILVQLITIAKYLDYADEMGRRKMFSLLRDLLLLPTTDQETITLVLGVLRKLTVDDRDFARVVVEVISEIRGDDEDINKAEAFVLVERMLQCLSITSGALATLQALEQHSSLEAVHNEVIQPAIQSTEPAIREAGIHCLGLYCLLDKNRAVEAMPLFVHSVRNGHTELQLKALKVVFDMLMLYGMDAMTEKLNDVTEIYALISDCSEHSDHSMQAVAAEGVAKLLLADVLTDPETLQSLVLLYFHPSTHGNNELRQCLSYFFQIYCYGASKHQHSLLQVAVPCLRLLMSTYDGLDAIMLHTMVAPLQIGQQLIDWLDPAKVLRASNADQPVSYEVHGKLMTELLRSALQASQPDCKLFVQLVNRLVLDATLPPQLLREGYRLAKQLQDSGRVGDAVTRRNLEKIRTSISKLLPSGSPASTDSEGEDGDRQPAGIGANDEDEVDALLRSDDGTTAPPVSKKRAISGRSGVPVVAKGTISATIAIKHEQALDEIDELLASELSD